MWIIEALTAFGELPLAPIALTGATFVALLTGGVVYGEQRRKTQAIKIEN